MARQKRAAESTSSTERIASRINLRPRGAPPPPPRRRSFRIVARAAGQQPSIVRSHQEESVEIVPSVQAPPSPVSVSSESSHYTLSESSDSSEVDLVADEEQVSPIYIRVTRLQGNRSFQLCTTCGTGIHDFVVEYVLGNGQRANQVHLRCLRSDPQLYFPREGERVLSFSNTMTAGSRNFCLFYLRNNLRPQRPRERFPFLPLPETLRSSSANQYLETRQLFQQRFGALNSTDSSSRNGLSPDILFSLPRVSFVQELDKEEEHVCVICLDNLQAGQEIVRLPCFHQFHQECIFQWLNCSKLCPIDKLDLETLVTTNHHLP